MKRTLPPLCRHVSGMLALVLLGGLLVAARAAAPTEDAFSLEHSAALGKATDAKPPATAPRIDFRVEVSPAVARRGETVQLKIIGSPKKGYHTYPLTQRSAEITTDEEGKPNPTQAPDGLSHLLFEDTPGLKPLWPVIEEPAPTWERVPSVGALLEYAGPFTWTQDILVLPDAQPGAHTLRFRIQLQVCKESCVNGVHHFEVPIQVSSAPPVALTGALQQRLQARQPEPKAVPVPPNLAAQPPEPEKARALPPSAPPAEVGTAAPQGLLGLLSTAAAAALLMLCTPCVFPMIPITVSFFLKQSEKEHHNPLLTAAVYSVTIVIVLAAAVLLLGGLIVQWANSAWLNLALGLVLVLFALSLLGMYELGLPSFLSNYTAAHEGKGGYAGAFFMALTFTITSFTCTGPFLGPLLVATKEMNLTLDRLVLASLVYSATFAAPFFVLALFPALLKRLPKSGGWMNAVKVVMGFLELAAALKFLANTDLALHPGNPWFFNYETVLCAWIALAFACGLYLVGLFRLPHDSPVEHVGVARMLVAAVFFGLAVYMTPLLWRETPMGVVGKALVGFLPLDTRPVPPAAGGAERELTWHRDYTKAWEEAKREGKLIFIDFTGVNCSNCRTNEKGVFPLPEVRQELQKYVRVQLYTDNVPDPRLTPSQAQAEGARNQKWESATFDEISTPLYVVLKPDPDQPTDGDKLKGMVLGRYAGVIQDPQQFAELLRKAHEGSSQVASAGGR